MTEDGLLRVEQVEAGYGDATVLRGVSVVVYPREIICIIGPNGSGKSTLFRAVMGYLRPFRGRIVFAGNNIVGFEPHQLVRRGLNCVLQGRTVFRQMTVQENLEMGGYALDGRERRGQVQELLESFPVLREHLHRRAGLLSGGQQRMLEIACALMVRPRLLLLDEPTLGLAPRIAAEVLQLVVGLHEAGLTILLIEQNARQALEIATRAYVLDRGVQRFEGTGKAILHNEDVRRLYLGVS